MKKNAVFSKVTENKEPRLSQQDIKIAEEAIFLLLKAALVK